jgi:carboxyl-terminal processing protease
VLQDLPDDIKASTDTSTKGEASLRGHLKGDAGKEQTGSQSYIPADEKNDKALSMAKELLRGAQVNSAFPPNVKDLSSQN